LVNKHLAVSYDHRCAKKYINILIRKRVLGGCIYSKCVTSSEFGTTTMSEFELIMTNFSYNTVCSHCLYQLI